MDNMFPITEISDVMLAFPANVLPLMPKYEDIPEEFRNRNAPTKWNNLFSDWFYFGLEKYEVKPKEGVDVDKALRHIEAIMRSFQPKHEHKAAAVAYLFSQWFDDVKWTPRERKTTA